MTKIGITAADSSLVKQCKRLAAEYRIPFFGDLSATSPEYLLLLDHKKLSLVKPATKSFKPFYVDFCSGKMAFRRSTMSAKNDLLAKAIAIKKHPRQSVFDLTAGLGRDGFLLASLGCKVTMVERNPVLYLMLQDGLQRFAAAFPEINASLDYQLIFSDAATFLKTKLSTEMINTIADSIYLDPMFPERTKSALVKKEMQVLHEIIGLAAETETEELFSLSLKAAKFRVIVKRPLLAPTLTTRKPDGCIKGKAVRYDLFSTAAVIANHATTS